MPHYRRLPLIAILAWSVSAAAVHAQSEGLGEPCNALCRFWLGRGDRPAEPPRPPVAAAEAPPPVEAVPADQEPETLPIVRMKRPVAPRGRRPLALRPSDGSVGEGQGGAQEAPGDPRRLPGTASQPMDLTPDEATAQAEPVPEARPLPMPPRRPMPRTRQARSRRPGSSVTEELPVSLSVAEPRPGSRPAAAAPGRDRPVKPVAPSKVAKPAVAPAAPAARPSAVAVTSPALPPGPPVVDGPVLRGILPALPAPPMAVPLAVAAPAPAAVSSLDAGSTSVGRTAPAVDPKHLHDVAPGPRPALTADSTATVPVAAKRPEPTDPDAALENLKETILRSAQEALKQSDVHGF